MSGYVSAWRVTFAEGAPGPAGRDLRVRQRWDEVTGDTVDLVVTVLTNDHDKVRNAALKYALTRLREPRLLTLTLEDAS